MIFFIIRSSLLENYQDSILFKLWGVSFIPWIYMFLVGVFFQKNFSLFHKLLSNKALYLIPIYLLISFLTVNFSGLGTGNEINPLLFILLANVIFSIAYSFPALSKKILKGNDISYGVYIYHIPIVNLFMYYGFMSSFYDAMLVIIFTILMAIMSWLLIEKKCIQFKKHPLMSKLLFESNSNKQGN